MAFGSLDGLWDHSPQSVVIINPAGRILAANAAATQRLADASPDGLENQDYFALLPTTLAESRRARLAALLAPPPQTDQPVTVERVPDPRSGMRLVRCTMARLDEDGAAPRIAVFEDDTLTVAAPPTQEEARFFPPTPPGPPNERRLESRFRKAFDQAPIGMALVDTEGRWRRVNRALTIILDRQPEDLVGHAMVSMTHPDDWAADLAWLDRALTGDAPPFDREKRFMRPNGSIVWARVTAALMGRGNHAPGEIVAQVLDITPKRRVEEALRASESRFRETFSAAAHGMAILDLNGRFQEVNPALCRMLNMGEKTLLTLDMAAVTHPEDLSVHVEAMRRLLSGDVRVFSAEKRFQRKGGGVVHAHMAFALARDGNGRPRHVISHVQDITRQVEAEVRLHQAVETAEQALLTKTRFLAAASHDLRQPLQALNLFVSVLAKRVTDKATQDIIAKIDRSLTALGDLLNTLLDVSRLEAGSILPEPRACDGALLLRRLVEELAPVAGERSLRLRLVAPSVTLHTDPHLLEIVLRNLIGNAIKYTDPGGRVLVGGRRQGHAVRLDVIDTGHGIADDQLTLIFQDFHRVAEERRTDPGGGLGLGLGIVSRVTQLLDVAVSVASTVGRGSRFSVTVPCVDIGTETASSDLLARPDAVGDPSASPNATAPHIVVVDDATQVRDSLALLLDGWGFRVTAFSNLVELTEALLTDSLDRPDAMVVDFHLPHQRTGVEAVALTRGHFRAPIPALILSGDAQTQRLHDINRGHLPVLQKPVPPDRLRIKLAELLRNRHGTPPSPTVP